MSVRSPEPFYSPHPSVDCTKEPLFSPMPVLSVYPPLHPSLVCAADYVSLYDSSGSFVVPEDTRTQSSAHVASGELGCPNRSWTGIGIGMETDDQCKHHRCEGCYDLDASKNVVRFCGGSPVDPVRYREWYQSFGFVEGIVPVVVDGSVRAHRGRNGVGGVGEMVGVGQAKVRIEGIDDGGGLADLRPGGTTATVAEELATWRHYEDMTFWTHNIQLGRNDDGDEVAEIQVGSAQSRARRVDDSGRLQSQDSIYYHPESRILLIQTEDRSDEDNQEDQTALMSSDEGSGVLGATELLVDHEKDRKEYDHNGRNPIGFIRLGGRGSWTIDKDEEKGENSMPEVDVGLVF